MAKPTSTIKLWKGLPIRVGDQLGIRDECCCGCPEGASSDSSNCDAEGCTEGEKVYCCATRKQAERKVKALGGEDIERCSKYGACPCYYIFCDPTRPQGTQWGYIICSGAVV